MLRSAFPQETPEELVARLVGTADGRPDVPSPLTGAGRVQALDGMTATPGELRSGGYAGDTTVPASSTTASPPDEPTDLLAGTRGSAVWWGLVGGAALLLSLLLRPLLARRPR
jgi:membrane-anchored mycosin MYCP